MAGTSPAMTPCGGSRGPRSAVDRLPAVSGRRVEHRLEHGAAARDGHRGRGRCGLALARGDELLIALALGRLLDAATAALDRRQRAAIEIVDITPRLQFAVIVDEGGLVGQVHPDRRGLELNVLLAVAEHPCDPRCRPVLLRAGDVEEDL